MLIEINVEGLPDDRDLLIPFSAVFCGGDLRITCFEEYRATAQEYAAVFGADPFCGAALGFLFTHIDSEMRRKGYRMPDDRFEIDYVGYLDVPPLMGEHETERGKERATTKNLTEIDIAESIELHQESFVCVENGAIVSAAVENFAEDNIVEIAVETAPDYRRKGYGYSCCAALCRDIIADGYSVSWQCSEDNAESVSLAEKLGFKPMHREMYMCYFAEDGEE